MADESHPLDLGYLFAVADGMGGYAHGGMASNIAIQALFEAFYANNGRPPAKALASGVETANLNVFQAAQRLNAGRMGTTLTAAGIRGRQMFLAHVGDSRAYLIRRGQATCLTRDHTAVGDLVRMKVITPDRIRTHAQRSILNRAVGLTLFVQPDLTDLMLEEGDRLVLCSDGLWSVVEDEDFGHYASKAPTAAELSNQLVERALENGTDDNVSAVSVFIHSMAGVPAHVVDPPRWKWLGAIRSLFSHRNTDTLAAVSSSSASDQD